MADQNNAFKAAVTQMVNLGSELLIEKISAYSKLNQCTDYKEQQELQKLYYNEIAATANVIRLFTGREISFQWQRGANGEDWGGFALYEILEDVPVSKSYGGTADYTHNRYSGEREKYRYIEWGKGVEQNKIIKIYEKIYDINANPRYVGSYLTSEFQTE